MKSKPKVLILAGAPGSGKTTYANKVLEKKPKTVILSFDGLRKTLFNDYKSNDKLVFKMFETCLLEAVNSGYDVIIDNTNTKLAYYNEILTVLKGKAYVRYKVFDEPVELLLARNKTRDLEKRIADESVITRMHTNLSKLDRNAVQKLIYGHNNEVDEPRIIRYESNPNLKKAIIVDIDGTIAHMNGKRGPFEWDKVGLDEPDSKIIGIVKRYADTHEVLVVSGRDGSCRAITQKWLAEFEVPHNQLYMRPAGDYRKDSIIKHEIYESKIKDQYDIEFVLDDRATVVNTWRALGLKCLQVEKGDF